MRNIFESGFNLPPGCRVSDIPGNRPEDEAWEAIINGFWNKKRTPEKDRVLSDADTPLTELIDEAIDYGIDIGQKQADACKQESDFYESQYHYEIRNPKLIAYFKKQRQSIKELCEAMHYIIRELDKAHRIRKDSIFMEYPNRILAKVEGQHDN